MDKFFATVKDKKLLNQAEQRVLSFEQMSKMILPSDYRQFLIDLEAYIDSKRIDIDKDEHTALTEHIDNIFSDYYFTLPEIKGEFNIADIANISLGYALLDEIQKGMNNTYTDFLIIGDIWHSSNCHYFHSLSTKKDNLGEVYLLLNKEVNHELNLTETAHGNFIFVCKSFDDFMMKIL